MKNKFFSVSLALTVLLSGALGAVLPSVASAEALGPITFETPTYVVGNINGQDGWIKTGSFDVAVTASGTPAGFGAQSLRISDAVTSGSFGDQTFAKPLTDSVGEATSTAGTFTAGVKQPHFEMQFDIASVLPTLQPGMHISVSPDRGDGSRMSYLRFEDQADGIHVFFDDVTDAGPVGTVATFNESDIATITRSPHTIKLTLDTIDGPSNDVVKVYVDGVLKATGTSWEDYYRYDPEAIAEQSPRIVKTVLFRESGTATSTDAGNGFFIDNFSLSSGPIPNPNQTCSAITLVSGTSTQTDGYTETNPNTPANALLPASYTPGTLSPALATQTVIPPWVDPATNASFTGSGALWVSTGASWPGGAGNTEGLPGNDQWRLFQDSFTLPAGAVVSSATLAYTADNAADVYLNGNTTPISTTNDVYGATPAGLPQNFANVYSAGFTPTAGNNVLDFAVRNWGGPFNPNPTGLVYKAVVNYCVPIVVPPVQGNIIVSKVTVPAGATTSFAFATTGTGYNGFSLTGVSAPNNQALNPGTYTVAEASSTGWTLSSVSCIYGDQEAIGTPVQNGEQIILPAGQTVNCTFTNTQNPVVPSTVSVHIFKNVNGVQATATSTGSAVFPMETTFNSPNLGSVTNAPFTIGPTGWGATDSAYEASFVGSNAGADYEADEILTTPVVGDSCDGSHTFSLAGYTTGATLAAAQAATPSLTIPTFTNLQSDQYEIVWNNTCATTGSLTIEKDTTGGDGTFSFTSDIPGHASFNITTAATVGSQTFTNLTPGTYHVTEVAKSGWTMTDNECSAVLVGASTAPLCQITNVSNKTLGEIRGTKFADRDGDGKLSDGDHHRLAGWTIYIDKNNNGVLDANESSTVTDSHGDYHFSGLPAGTYVIREVGQAGWIETVPSTGKYTIVLAAGKISKKNNFGNFKLGAISGMKYNDANANGRKDSGEVGLVGWTINLKGPHGFATSTVTDANGNYSFTGLLAGSYTLSEVQQTGWHQKDHPGTVKIQSGTNSTKDNFGNTQKVIGRYGGNGYGDNDGNNGNHHS